MPRPRGSRGVWPGPGSRSCPGWRAGSTPRPRRPPSKPAAGPWPSWAPGFSLPCTPRRTTSWPSASSRAGGAIVSQFWPQAPPRKINFPRRNIVMSGMAAGTVVVEAAATSGAKMQARLALEHGKRLFLPEPLVASQEWARRYATRPGVTVVGDLDRHPRRAGQGRRDSAPADAELLGPWPPRPSTPTRTCTPTRRCLLAGPGVCAVCRSGPGPGLRRLLQLPGGHPAGEPPGDESWSRSRCTR